MLMEVAAAEVATGQVEKSFRAGKAKVAARFALEVLGSTLGEVAMAKVARSAWMARATEASGSAAGGVRRLEKVSAACQG